MDNFVVILSPRNLFISAISSLGLLKMKTFGRIAHNKRTIDQFSSLDSNIRFADSLKLVRNYIQIVIYIAYTINKHATTYINRNKPEYKISRANNFSHLQPIPLNFVTPKELSLVISSKLANFTPRHGTISKTRRKHADRHENNTM